ncbi:hypothetical protein FHR94_003336 [Halomonas cerina]|uniref:Uncharacterized protein n=1 Tax=Halomonas cerina TaxID=447424 RepID=A0A839VDL9_9GAMM|nr:hypothetical protein [Halomonas cerina]
MVRSRLVQRCRDWTGCRGLRTLVLWSVFLMLYQATRPPRRDIQRNARR